MKQEARKALSESLAVFVPSIMQSASQIAGRLELFRTETLASFDPVDKKKESANAEMDDILDSTVGLENFVVPEMPIANTRAGLYIYLNAAVGLVNMVSVSCDRLLTTCSSSGDPL